VNLRQTLRSYFTFNRRERNGILILLGVILLLLVTLFIQEQRLLLPVSDFSAFDRMAAGLRAAEYKQTAAQKDSSAHESRLPTPAEAAGQRSLFHRQELFYFNPNNLPAADWIRLGLSPAQAQSIKNYEAKGGRFETKEDVRKMYVISPQLYNRIEAYIVIPQPEAQKTGPAPVVQTEKAKPRATVVELNSADTSALKSLPGVGSVFAKRILSYRNRLGGFHSAEQLLEVYGFDVERYEQVKNFVKTDPQFLSRIPLNTAAAAELRQHPYVTPNTATAIVSYRKLHGPFKTLEALQDVDLVNPELYRKLAPYLIL